VALFNRPSRLQAVSVAGIERLYVLDDNNGCVRSMPLGLPPNGTVVRSETLCSDASTLAHVGPDAKFPNGTTRGWQHIDGPQGFWVAPDAKMLFILDTDNNRVKVAHRSPGGNYTPWAVLAGSGAVGHSDGAAANASFSQPHGLSVAPRAGFVLVGDTFASCIRAVRISDGAVSTIAGRCGWGGHQDVPRGGDALSARFNHPHEVTVDPRNESIVYVSDVECFDDQPVQLASLNERHHCGKTTGTNEEKFFTGVRKLELAYDGKGAVSVVSVSTVAGFFNASTPSRESSNNIGMGDGMLTSGRFHYVHGVAIRPRSSGHGRHNVASSSLRLLD
jgi:hypothetical protein